MANRPCKEVREFIDLGFVTVLITVNLSLGMKGEDLGRMLTHGYFDELLAHGIDYCGELHTAVLDGPMFQRPVHFAKVQSSETATMLFLLLELE